MMKMRILLFLLLTGCMEGEKEAGPTFVPPISGNDTCVNADGTTFKSPCCRDGRLIANCSTNPNDFGLNVNEGNSGQFRDIVQGIDRTKPILLSGESNGVIIGSTSPGSNVPSETLGATANDTPGGHGGGNTPSDRNSPGNLNQPTGDEDDSQTPKNIRGQSISSLGNGLELNNYTRGTLGTGGDTRSGGFNIQNVGGKKPTADDLLSGLPQEFGLQKADPTGSSGGSPRGASGSGGGGGGGASDIGGSSPNSNQNAKSGLGSSEDSAIGSGNPGTALTQGVSYVSGGGGGDGAKSYSSGGGGGSQNPLVSGLMDSLDSSGKPQEEAAPNVVTFGAQTMDETTLAPVKISPDPKDYFSRLGSIENLFKTIERRYQATMRAWIMTDLNSRIQTMGKPVSLKNTGQ